MSGLFDFLSAVQLRRLDVPFDALIMAAALRADTDNRATLAAAFPTLTAEAAKRWDAPGGRLPGEGVA